jgi:hypothetical protein
MTELESLATALRQELGHPPEAWQATHRERFRKALAERPARPTLIRFVLPVAATLTLAATLIWIALRERPAEGVERWLVASELREPFRFEDGSSITLDPEGRGRLVADSTSVRFDLHGGRARFDVTPGQQRAWTITAGRNEVRVVGTRFNVSYAASEAFEVDVERGIVSVRVPERSASVELKAGDRLRGGPGHMEVAHGASKALSPAPTDGNRATESRPEGTSAPAARAEPPSEAAANAEWRERYRKGKYAESLTLLRASGAVNRLDELPPNTLAVIADIARLGGDPELAVRALNVLMRRFPRAPEARDGKFLLGRVHALRGDGAAAISAFESYLKPGGSMQYANEAVGRLMELYSMRGDDERARVMARRYLESAPDGPYRRLARSLAVPRD